MTTTKPLQIKYNNYISAVIAKLMAEYLAELVSE